MELTDKHLEMIRKAVREVDYGSVTINISAGSNKLDLSIQKRVRYEDEPCVPVCETNGYKGKGGRRVLKKT